MEATTVKRYWYHLTQTNHGDSFTARRRPPLLRLKVEPTTPRVCVSNSIPGCFAAILLDRGAVGHVYRYYGNTVPPSGIWDSVITGERWIVPPATLHLYKVFPAVTVEEIYLATRLRLERDKKPAPWRVRIAQYAIAHKVLYGRIPLWVSDYVGEDPEDFVLA